MKIYMETWPLSLVTSLWTVTWLWILMPLHFNVAGYQKRYLFANRTEYKFYFVVIFQRKNVWFSIQCRFLYWETEREGGKNNIQMQLLYQVNTWKNVQVETEHGPVQCFLFHLFSTLSRGTPQENQWEWMTGNVVFHCSVTPLTFSSVFPKDMGQVRHSSLAGTKKLFQQQ